MTLISSRANERVKQIRALRDRREREATGAFFAEGSRLLRAALAAGATVEQVVAVPERLTPEEQQLLDVLGLPVLEVTPAVFDSLAFREEAQSLGAVVRQRWQAWPPQPPGLRCWVALPEVQHPGNLGTIVRTCDAIGGDGVILLGRTTDPYHPVSVRGSLGAVFSQRLLRTSQAAFAQWAPASGCSVIGTSPEGTLDFREADYASHPVVLLMGSERIGLSGAQLALCDAVVRVPMAGQVESLNLAVAAALVLYEVLRQQGPAGPA